MIFNCEAYLTISASYRLQFEGMYQVDALAIPRMYPFTSGVFAAAAIARGVYVAMLTYSGLPERKKGRRHPLLKAFHIHNPVRRGTTQREREREGGGDISRSTFQFMVLIPLRPRIE